MKVVTWGGGRDERAGDEMRSDTHNINSAITPTDPPHNDHIEFFTMRCLPLTLRSSIS